MDLSTLSASNDAVEMPIVNPITNEVMTTETGENISLMVIGTDNDLFIKANNAILNRRLKKASVSRKVQVTAEELESESLQRTVACVVGFNNILLNGENLEYNKLNTEKLLKTLPAIREQVEEFISDRANFLK